MGVVWAGRHDAIAMDVAVKLASRQIASEVAGSRLRREARVAARHNHSALVRVFDFGRTADWLEAQGVTTDVTGVALSEYGTMPRVSSQPDIFPSRGDTTRRSASPDAKSSIEPPERRSRRAWRDLSAGVVAYAGIAVRTTAAVLRGALGARPSLRASRLLVGGYAVGGEHGEDHWKRVVGHVERGETIVSVATRHGVSVASLATWSRFVADDKTTRSFIPSITESGPRRLRVEFGGIRLVFEEGAKPAYVAAIARAMR